MPDAVPVARSPISPSQPELVVDGWVVSRRRSDAALQVVDCTPMAKVVVKAPVVPRGPGEPVLAHVLGVPFGVAARQTWDIGSGDVETLLVGSGPGEWLALASPGAGPAVVDHLAAWCGRDDCTSDAGAVTVVDLTHGHALVRLTGATSADVLAMECGVDLTDDVFADGSVQRCSVSGVATEVVRDDLGGDRSYLLHCERSSGQYLWDSLLDAGGEFGIDVAGFVR